ncbi:hypothetical protein AXG93_4548s1300 [Marchantia polymorpha subsp. ruderalis]|uniref:Integrase catalytic domain-containing protein n=1 Tax=Marchantia polymorpha subsp. ruderalis TaxID=1480154 RepID=A0A176WAJ8_MARPO|nr:hypothetical protein AXG93_4548s1300 [Marchantia polymorpha subsp. ruderalis]
MAEGKDLMEHLDEFNKLIVDLKNIDVKYDDDDQALVLLYSLPRSYEHMVDILQHVARWDRADCTLVDVTAITEPQETLLASLWDKRLGHLSDRGLKELSKQGLFGGDKLDDLEFCENCIHGKATKVKFTQSVDVTWDMLNYVHSDLWRLLRTPTLGGGWYYIMFIDDCSRKVWVYNLKHKDEVFGKFKEWKKMVEVRIGRNIKKLRTDNGLKYLDDEFNRFIKEEGMVRHKAVRGILKQNGLAKPMNQTLLERMKCMLFEAGVKGWKLWYKEDEASKCVISRDVFREFKFYMAVATQEAKDSMAVTKDRAGIEMELLGRCSNEARVTRVTWKRLKSHPFGFCSLW